MTRTLGDAQKLAKDEWIREYDKQAKYVEVEGLAFIRDMIFQREYAEQGDRMEKMTRRIQTLTWWIAGLTVINTAAVIAALVMGR